MAKKLVRNSKNIFVADLSSVKLSAEQQRSIEEGIREVVMLELARLDHGGLVTVKPPRKWQTVGIVAVPVDRLGSAFNMDIETAVGPTPFGG